MTYVEPETITIIEGPPPEFVLSQDMWSMSMWESSRPRSVGVCQMRTFKAQTLMDRCTRAWNEGRTVVLDFPQYDGLRQRIEVLAARPGHVEEGDLLNLWVAVPDGVLEQADADDDLDDSDEGEEEDPGSFA